MKVRLEDRDEPVEFAYEIIGAGRGPARGEQRADPPEDSGDEGMVFYEIVDDRGELRGGGAQGRQELAVLTGVMGVDRGAEAEAVAEQVLADDGGRAGRSGAAGPLPAH